MKVFQLNRCFGIELTKSTIFNIEWQHRILKKSSMKVILGRCLLALLILFPPIRAKGRRFSYSAATVFLSLALLLLAIWRVCRSGRMSHCDC